MSGKGAAVFWIGLLLILANFWISGQSTAVWSLFTGASGIVSSGKKGSSQKSPNSLPLTPPPPVVGP